MPSDHQWEKIYQQEGRLWKEPFPRFGDVIQTFRDRGCKKILDLGCGSGRHVVGFAEAEFQVTGIDISPTGLKLAQQWLVETVSSDDQDSSLANTVRYPPIISALSTASSTRVSSPDWGGLRWGFPDLVQADIRDPLPFGDGAFDGLMSTQVIHHALLAEVLATIGEIWRILAPGGLAVVSVAGLIHDDTEYLEIEPDTYLPQTGWEAGLPHHIFDEERLRDAFGAFEIEFIERRDNGRILMIQALRPGS
jgi:SAM-dependent methyltransferase